MMRICKIKLKQIGAYEDLSIDFKTNNDIHNNTQYEFFFEDHAGMSVSNIWGNNSSLVFELH